MRSENESIIEAAAAAVQARSPLDPHVSAPENWREIDLQYDGQLVVRLRPAGDDTTSVEVFAWGDLVASEILRRYKSAEHLAELVEDVHRRAIERA